MKFYSTRNKKEQLTGSQAIIKGVSVDGGLFVPQQLPQLSGEDLTRMQKLDYVPLAAELLSLFLPELADRLPAACEAAYAPARFGAAQPVRLHPLEQNTTVLELFHGPTLAFKDMALQLMPHLMTLSLAAQKDSRRALILTATSGDTGKAALEGFSNVPGIEVAVFYPHGGVSEMQRLQMATHPAQNTHVFAVEGNFDDTQTGVKCIFASQEANETAERQGAFLSSANSINIGRLLPQVVYYVYSYLQLRSQGRLAEGETFDVAVPTGNFGNILAAWYARGMGLPIRRLICASNRNHILTDFFASGQYDTRREFHKTLSPSMDILISSNLERLLFSLLEEDDAACAALMRQLSESKDYALPQEALAQARQTFAAHWADDAETRRQIARVWQRHGYCIDPHTAVAFSAVEALGEQVHTLVVATASPFKFSGAVLEALGQGRQEDEFSNLAALSTLTGLPVPPSLEALRTAPLRFNTVCSREGMEQLVVQLLGNI